MPLLLEEPTDNLTMNSSALDSSGWKMSPGISGPAIAFFVSLEFLISLPSNILIIAHSIYNRKKSFSNSSTIFLFNFALSDVLVSLFYMPILIVSSGSGEWIFGDTDCIRSILCQIHGFVLMYTGAVSLDLLAVLSVDRFLYIVKANSYHKLMTLKTAVTTVAAIWSLDIILTLTPYYGPGLGVYNWSGAIGGCGPTIDRGDVNLLIFISTHLSIIVIVITTTSVWTFLFTFGFLKKTLKRHKTMLNLENFDIQKGLYTKRIKNLIGIFGSLLLSNSISWIPIIITTIISIFYALPPELGVTNIILYLLNNVTNPIIQIYFRKELCDFLKKLFGIRCKFFKEVKMGTAGCFESHQEHHARSQSKTNTPNGRNPISISPTQDIDHTKIPNRRPHLITTEWNRIHQTNV